MNQFPPSPRVFHEDRFNDTGGKWKKFSITKVLIILFVHLWVVDETYTLYKFLPSSSLSGVCSLILCPLFATGVNDTGGKFATGVVETGGNLPPVSLTPVANLPPLALTPVVHLDLQISPRIFEKNRNDPNVIIRGLGEGDS